MNSTLLIRLVCNADLPIALRLDAQRLLNLIHPHFLTTNHRE
jgi:hypothetical protein